MGLGRRRVRRGLALVGLLGALLVAPVAAASTRGGNYPVLVVGAGTRSDYVLVAEGCASLRCLVLDRLDPVTGRITRVTRPPLSPVRDSPSGDLGRLAFASARLGVALVGQNGTTQKVYATSDGARSWQRVAFGPGESVLDVTAGGGAVYVVLAHCRTTRGFERCRDFVLAHASAARAWTSERVPAAVTAGPPAALSGPQLGSVAAYGSRVVVVQTSQGSVTLVRTSPDAGRTWTTRSVAWPTLANIAGCSLSPEGPLVLWASCPTGMQVSFYRSADGGRTWSAVHQGQFSGTGGGFFAAASSSTAYLDYGYPRHVLYVVRAPGLRPVRVGPLPCADFTSETFSDSRHGAITCTGSTSPVAAPRLMVSSDQGHNWRAVSIR